MADAENLLSTPEGYATPAQLASTREYAKALMMGSGQQPIHHWTQGVSNMVSALLGGNMDYQANKKENEANAVMAGRMLPTVPNSPASTPNNPVSFSGGPPSAGQTNADDTLGKSSNAISGIESGGDYSNKGPVTKTGDRAYGKYQVMGKNIPEWTQAALGKAMTPDEFLANPQAQEAVFKQKFGEYTQKYGPEGAAKAWFAGEHGMNNPNAHDQLGTTVASYGQKFSNAFNGPDNASTTPAVQAISTALRGQTAPAGGTQVAAGKSAAPQTPMPQPNGSGIYIDPALVQQRPQYNEGQMRGILSDPRISEQTKMQLLQQYQTQGQPIDVPYPGGIVRVNPNNPHQQQFIPDLQKGETSIGEIKHPSYGTVTPGQGGGVQFNPAVQTPVPTVGPRSEAEPPAAAPQGAPGASPVPVPSVAQSAPAAPTAPPAGPVKVASLDPTAGVAEAAGNTAPSATPVAAQAPPVSPLTRMAQAGPPPGISQQDWDTYTQKKTYDNKVAIDQKAAESKIAVEQEAQNKATEFATKKYDTLSTQAQSARKQMPNLDLALALMSDPNFHSGLAAGAQDVWARLKAATGIEPMANAPNEAFDKIMSGTILDNMRTALSGLGQVRLAEIGLLTKANANRTNTDASNRAVLEVSRRGVQSIDHLDQLGQQYMSGDEVVDPIDGKVLLKANVGKDGEVAPRHGLDVGYDKIARQFTLNHPSFTPEEIKRYNTIFETGKDPSAVTTAAPAAPGGGPGKNFPEPPTEAVGHLKGDTSPNADAQFDAVFGPGAAARARGAK